MHTDNYTNYKNIFLTKAFIWQTHYIQYRSMLCVACKKSLVILYKHACTLACFHRYMYMNGHACMHMHAHACVCTHTHTHTNTHTQNERQKAPRTIQYVSNDERERGREREREGERERESLLTTVDLRSTCLIFQL